jgi:hypothetical protein
MENGALKTTILEPFCMRWCQACHKSKSPPGSRLTGVCQAKGVRDLAALSLNHLIGDFSLATLGGENSQGQLCSASQTWLTLAEFVGVLPMSKG